jgi:hypothetical protein
MVIQQHSADKNKIKNSIYQIIQTIILKSNPTLMIRIAFQLQII